MNDATNRYRFPPQRGRLTRQEVFDRVVAHLCQMPRRSMAFDGHCRLDLVPSLITAALRPGEIADANALQAKARSMSPADLELLDEMRRFYEPRQVAS